MALAEKVLRKIHKLNLVPKAIKLLPRLSFIVAILSILWLVTLPQDGNYRNCYISENALMPGQVTSYFRESEWNIVRGYRHEIKQLESQPIEQRNEAITAWLQDLGLPVSRHHNGFTNDTLYSIMHASRGENTEAMALVVPWVNSDNEFNEGAMALGMALMRYFQRISVWSKNIILVIPPDGKQSLRSWVNAYHTSLDDTAGSIEAAIIMEYGKQGDGFQYYDMFYEGLNGQLPNLDLLNTANQIGQHEGISCSIQDISDRAINFTNRLKTLFSGILRLVIAGSRDVHGHEAFSGWQIQAFTIKAKGTQGHDVTQFGRIVDSTFRSVNNLLEKFHQSFFFYLMLSPKHFVSIGTYLPSAVMLAVAYAFGALNAILNSGIDLDQIPQNLSKLLIIAVVAEVVCVGLSVIIPQASKETLNHVPLALSILPVFVVRSHGHSSTATSFALIGLALLIIAFLITALLIVHFALALTIGLLAIPLTFVPTVIQKNRKLAISCLFISNPFFVFVLANGYFAEEFFPNLIASWNQLQCWTWLVIILGWFPAWLMIAYATTGISTTPVVCEIEKNEKDEKDEKL
ncbi:Gaa1 protein [Candida orthopsilosis Co 90-125]|uniref:Gaa1 protein n=1 Tax=Candida orthopsilosis (strain 90-125) TaxID=1136231 RepID=H8X0T5_CANO9|nr:Gaa1 protein [Candida orthopsilosis Co 90-125]CCG21974.1 Gaa1 protein [Candida orthopsilosis Co 90-125]